MNISDGKSDLSSKLLLIKFHTHDLVGKTLVKQSVDLGTTREL